MKKFLSLLLSVVLILSCFTINTYAAEKTDTWGSVKPSNLIFTTPIAHFINTWRDMWGTKELVVEDIEISAKSFSSISVTKSTKVDDIITVTVTPNLADYKRTHELDDSYTVSFYSYTDATLKRDSKVTLESIGSIPDKTGKYIVVVQSHQNNIIKDSKEIKIVYKDSFFHGTGDNHHLGYLSLSEYEALRKSEIAPECCANCKNYGATMIQHYLYTTDNNKTSSYLFPAEIGTLTDLSLNDENCSEYCSMITENTGNKKLYCCHLNPDSSSILISDLKNYYNSSLFDTIDIEGLEVVLREEYNDQKLVLTEASITGDALAIDNPCEICQQYGTSIVLYSTESGEYTENIDEAFLYEGEPVFCLTYCPGHSTIHCGGCVEYTCEGHSRTQK